MLTTIASLQSLLIGAVLVWSGRLKLFGRNADTHAKRSALGNLVGEKRERLAYRTLGVVELLIAAALVLPPPLWIDAAASIALTAGFCGYLAYIRIADPGAACGCMGLKPAPVTWRSFGRAGILLAGSVLALTVSQGWHAAIADAPVLGATVLLAEALLVAGLSPEFDEYWLMPLRRLHNRLTKPLAPGSFEVPLASTVVQLQRSGVYREVAGLVHSDVIEHWDDGDWRFVAYGARVRDRAATAVFAVPRLKYAPGEVRVAIVDDETQETLVRHDAPPPVSAEKAEWALPEAAPAT